MKRSAFLLAGEASGDLQGSLLAEQLRRERPDIELYGVGGDRMEAAGVELIFRSDELAVVGLVEVLRMLPHIFQALDQVRDFLSARRPDVFIPIDYPDFNLRLLPHAYRLGIPIVYYIGPQLWAWRRERLDWLARYLTHMIVIFPFEEDLYKSKGVPVTWVGHPLVEKVPADKSAWRRELRTDAGLDDAKPVLAILPGSRRSEIRRIAPVLADSVSRLRETLSPAPQLVVGQASGLKLDVREVLGLPEAAVLDGFEALGCADMAWAASGTATLEALLVETPTIVVYRVQGLTYQIAKRAIRVPHIAMANLVAGDRVFPELVQDEARPETVASITREWLESESVLAGIRTRLAAARAALGEPGAIGRAARTVLKAAGL